MNVIYLSVGMCSDVYELISGYGVHLTNMSSLLTQVPHQ